LPKLAVICKSGVCGALTEIYNILDRRAGSDRVCRIGRFDEHEFGGLDTKANPSHGGLDVLHVNLRSQITQGKNHGQSQQHQRAAICK